jgi:DNA polymerase-3 subunit beta
VRFQCTQEALADALSTVGRVVPTKSTLPVLTNVLLEADVGGWLRVVATNLELTVSRRVRAIVSAEGRTTAPARLLAEYVALLDRGKQVSLKLNPTGHKLHLACERYKANVATLERRTFHCYRLSRAASGGRSTALSSSPRSSRLFLPPRPSTLAPCRSAH